VEATGGGKSRRYIVIFWRTARVFEKVKSKCVRASVPNINWTLALDFAFGKVINTDVKPGVDQYRLETGRR